MGSSMATEVVELLEQTNMRACMGSAVGCTRYGCAVKVAVAGVACNTLQGTILLHAQPCRA